MPRIEAMHSRLAEGQVRDESADAVACLTRVHFTAEDLAHTRFIRAPAPLVETVLSLVEVRRRTAASSSRRPGQAPAAFPATARPLLDLIPRKGYWPEFLDPAVVDLDEGLEIVRATPRRKLRDQLARSWHGAARPSSWLQAVANGEPEALEAVARGLRDFHSTMVAPQWGRIVASFRANVSEQVPIWESEGLAALFSALHWDLAWRDGSLERSGRAGEFWLSGKGMQIVPSVLWNGPPLFSIDPTQASRNALIYPTRRLGNGYSAKERPDLTRLLGRTRAAALQALRSPCGTAELAARIQISASYASEHASALREADLVQTVRCGRGVRHSLTALGRSLLNGQ